MKHEPERGGAAGDEHVASVSNRAEALMDSGDTAAALRLLAAAIAVNGARPALLTAAANAWVVAVDHGDVLESWPDAERDTLHRYLILQEGSDASPPIFHHRIAAQHSGGVTGHLERAARALEPTLQALLAEAVPDRNAVLMALLLRGATVRIDQERLGTLHEQYFAHFPIQDLNIPYSVVFDRNYFRRNVADLRRYVLVHGATIIDGSLPLTHVLLLHWLVADAFSYLPPDWAIHAIDARRRSHSLCVDEAAAARSLALRFSITDEVREDATLMRLADALSATRRTLAVEANGAGAAAIARLDQRPRQFVGAALNEARARFPMLARLRPRIALCVSGQLRGFRKAWPTWRSLLSGVDATVFVDSWNRIGRGTAEPFRSVLPFEGDAFSRAYKRVGAELGLDELRARYPSLFAELDRSGVVGEADLSALYGTCHVSLDDEAEPAFATLSNSEKMYLKIERCFRMAEASGKQFDLIVRLRPDKPIVAVAFDWSDLIVALRTRPALYCETALGVHYGGLLMGDQAAIGLPEASRVYAETFSRAPPIAAVAPYRMEAHLWPHTSVAQLCWVSGIDVRKLPIKFGPFQEAEPLPARCIRDALNYDATSRMDAVDGQLIAANRIDLGA
ncbi:MAG: hypothetical protein AVDCRST_MAG91-1493 [uncultured Sphingomonadaceae bacterium]|uniref:Uncharacterized protein n=1 Tax=uncultured Sphingomonadaceae bacterium TaxID=169976 RepID=A0A6J4SXQ7_9SPHN|nr:MAG: hypothetical protein AVDCRST_MAG91-1493 [uncultured Sphingomonadaceae bacterium]